MKNTVIAFRCLMILPALAASTEAKDRDGPTPLMVASEELLRKHGARR